MANAFNTASWGQISKALERLQIPGSLVRIIRSYLSDKTLRDGDGKTICCGVSQGSFIRPILCNLMYDDLLNLDLKGSMPGHSSATLVAFADDVAVIATGWNKTVIEGTTGMA